MLHSINFTIQSTGRSIAMRLLRSVTPVALLPSSPPSPKWSQRWPSQSQQCPTRGIVTTDSTLAGACKRQTHSPNRMSLNLSQLVGMVISTPLWHYDCPPGPSSKQTQLWFVFSSSFTFFIASIWHTWPTWSCFHCGPQADCHPLLSVSLSKLSHCILSFQVGLLYF